MMAIQIQGICPLLQVFDMPASLAFYRDVLGFEIVQAAPPGATGDGFGWVWLRRDGTELMLNTAYDPDAERPSVPDRARVAAHDDTALFIGCPDVDAAYHHLLAHGLGVEKPVVTHYGMKQLYVKDPDGFGLCFQWTAGSGDAR
jgi:catechol 2,3-dioxygenase-like lactoylglutathione lyase family enzyme